jgi:hypothetical protein
MWQAITKGKLIANGTQLCLVADFEILNNQNTRNYEQRTELQ